MILLWAVILGFTAGLARAIMGKRRYAAPRLKYIWLVFVAFIPQWFAFRLPATRITFPEPWVPVVLVGSQALLLIFAACNLRVAGFPVLALGLLLNFVVIVLNRGMMPLSPELAAQLLPADAPPGLWFPYERFGIGKDIVLPKGATNLWFLSDVFLLKLPQSRVAFSVGDILIAAGAIWLFWSFGGQQQEKEQTS